MARNLIYLYFVLLLSGCVSNKKFQYLQKDDVNVGKSDRILKNSVLRSYNIDDFVYRLQPEDVIAIKVYSLSPDEINFFNFKQGGGGRSNVNQFQTPAQSLVNGYLIDEEGNIEFPVVGKVKLWGMTVFEGQEYIRDLAVNYIEAPVVEIRLLNFRFTVLGAVRREGVNNTLNNRITVLEAIGLSGGFTDMADKRNVKVIRQRGDIVDVYYLNLLEEEFLTSPQYFVNQNDVIIVAPLRQRPYQTYFGKNLALLISSISLLLLVLSLTNAI